MIDKHFLQGSNVHFLYNVHILLFSSCDPA